MVRRAGRAGFVSSCQSTPGRQSVDVPLIGETATAGQSQLCKHTLV